MLTSRQEGRPHLSAHSSVADRSARSAPGRPRPRRRRRPLRLCLHVPAARRLGRVGQGTAGQGVRVIDFSADYRLNDAATYRQWYEHDHPDPERLGKTPYGLPELFREQIPEAKLIANPGCYPTSAILPLAPLLKAGLDRAERHHRRFQERRLRRGPHAEADHALSRVQREHLGLQRRQASPHAGDRADPRPGHGQERRGDLHAAPDADGPRHPLRHLRPPDPRGH